MVSFTASLFHSRLAGALTAAAAVAAILTLSPPAYAQGEERASSTGTAKDTAGEPKSTRTKLLEAGARLLQGTAPLNGFDIYLVGFHPMKDHPEKQMEAHHYCHQVNEDFAQCVLFDGDTKDTRLNGIEYIISEKLFATLPDEEKKYWHPHNGEILSGQLVAPSIPGLAEKALMRDKMNSYGKTWHVWNTGFHTSKPGEEIPGGDPLPGGDALPLGDPMLAWSFNRDGEAHPGLVESRDRKMNLDSAKIRKERAELREFARPQSGVDDLKGKFSRQTRDIPGVIDKKTATQLNQPNQPRGRDD